MIMMKELNGNIRFRSRAVIIRTGIQSAPDSQRGLVSLGYDGGLVNLPMT